MYDKLLKPRQSFRITLYICCDVHASFFQLTLDTPRYTAGHIPLYCRFVISRFCRGYSVGLLNLHVVAWYSVSNSFRFRVDREQPCVTKGYVYTFFRCFLGSSGVPRWGGWGVQTPPPPKFRRPSKIVSNSTRL